MYFLSENDTFAHSMLSHQELKDLSQVSGRRTSFSLALDGLGIGLLFALVANWIWTWPLAVVLMGRQQLALAILMHDGAHRRLYKRPALNEWVGQLALAAPLLFSMDSYRKLHLKHHLAPLTPEDPDLSLTGGYPVSRVSLLRKLGRDLIGVSYFKFIRYFIYLSRKGAAKARVESAGSQASGPRPGQRPGTMSRGMTFVSIALAQGLILSTLLVAGHPWLYLTLWLLPAMTVLQVLLRIRGITEHAGYAPNPDQRLNARTVINPVQTFFLAPHAVHYHIEHHVYPSVPFHRLHVVHRLLKERGMIPEENLYRGYGKVLRELTGVKKAAEASRLF